MTFWDRLDIEIAEARSSRPEITKALGISPNSISTWKTRHTYPAADVAVKLARELGVTVEYLIEGEGSAGWLPSRISAIVNDLMTLNENELTTVAKQIHALADDQRAAQTGGG